MYYVETLALQRTPLHPLKSWKTLGLTGVSHIMACFNGFLYAKKQCQLVALKAL